MKLQHIAIIFIIIILPISLVLSNYVSSHLETIKTQTIYDANLVNAAHDSIRAFQINTQNNEFSDIANSKIRDIEASINVFYSSLATNLEVKGYTKEELKEYTPAIVFTLYDGYHIYTNYYDTELQAFKYGLKPFTSYSCRYIDVNSRHNDFIVNYTLDNTITIIGTVEGNYVTKTGHLISYDEAEQIAQDPARIADYVNLSEVLEENLVTLDDDASAETINQAKYQGRYQYVVYNNQKIYLEKNPTNESRKYFKYSSQYRKDYISSSETVNALNIYYDATTKQLSSDSAKKFYQEAAEFTIWVNENLRNVTQQWACDAEGYKIPERFATQLDNARIFDTRGTQNNPLLSSSPFNEQRRNVIRYSIETNLIQAMKTYTDHSSAGYEFAMPELTEGDWDNIENNICELVFLQGFPIGGKIYNNYCVVSNNANKETVSNDAIYILSKDDEGKIEYHKPGCKALITALNYGRMTLEGAYSTIDFKRKSISLTGEDVNALAQILESNEVNINEGKYAYFYPQPYEACYDCIVAASDAYSTDDIIAGKVIDKFGRDHDEYGESYGNITDLNGDEVNITNLNGVNLQKYYLTALARARYDLYLVNAYFGY